MAGFRFLNGFLCLQSRLSSFRLEFKLSFEFGYTVSQQPQVGFRIFDGFLYKKADICGWVSIFEWNFVCTKQFVFDCPKIQIEFRVAYKA